MAKILITIEDGIDGIVNYKSECDLPTEVTEQGIPTAAIQLGIYLIDQIKKMNELSSSENSEIS